MSDFLRLECRHSCSLDGQHGTENTLTRNASGLFLRNPGSKRTPTGYAQHKFYLGRDESAAAMVSLRLE